MVDLKGPRPGQSGLLQGAQRPVDGLGQRFRRQRSRQPASQPVGLDESRRRILGLALEPLLEDLIQVALALSLEGLDEAHQGLQ